jgi:fermentation-respiration switch protein FrsA (DUF1100 family)
MSLAGDALDRFVESRIFFPDRHLESRPADFGLDYEDVRFRTDDGVMLHGWYVPAKSCRAVLLFCHGNAGNISHRLDNVKRLHAVGLSVLIFDYRGYGLSEGNITEKGFYRDAEAAHEIARRIADDQSVELVVFGRSLGGIAATHIAANRTCSGVILESTFTDLASMTSFHFPLPFAGAAVGERFNAAGSIPHVTAPLLFFHGNRDQIVPFELGRDLYEAANQPKQFVTLEGAGHNDTYLVGGDEYFRKITTFIDGLGRERDR